MLFSCVVFLGAGLYLSGETLKSKNENDPTKEKKVREQLAQVVKKIDLEGARLDESLKVVCKGTGIKLYIDWKKLKKETQIDYAQCLVHVHMSNVTRGKLISYVLRSGGGISRFEYIVEKDGIRITTMHILEQPTIERQYDVSDVVRILGKTKARKQLEHLFFILDLWPPCVSVVPLHRWQGTKITVAGDLYW